MNPNLQTLALLSAASIAGAPYVTAFLTQSRLPKWANALIAFLVCLLAGLVSFWQSGGTLGSIHSLSALLAAVGVIFTGAKLFYVKLGYKDPMILALKSLSLSAQNPAAASSAPDAFSVPTQTIITAPSFDLSQPNKTLVLTVVTETPAPSQQPAPSETPAPIQAASETPAETPVVVLAVPTLALAPDAPETVTETPVEAIPETAPVIESEPVIETTPAEGVEGD